MERVTLEDLARLTDAHGHTIRFGYAGTYSYEFGPNGEPWGALVGEGEGHGWTIADAVRHAIIDALGKKDGRP